VLQPPKVKVERHECTRGLVDAIASHPKPDGDDKTRKSPLPGVPTIGVLNCQLVNLWIARLGSDGVLRGHKDLYWFELNVPTSSEALLVLPELSLQ
jgi:hypothetical protein